MYRFHFIVIILIGFLSSTHLKAKEVPFFFNRYSRRVSDALFTIFRGRIFYCNQWLVYQHPFQDFHSLASRVVTFHKVGSQLFLLQSLKGSVLNEDIPSSIILAEFPIIKHLSSDDEGNF